MLSSASGFVSRTIVRRSPTDSTVTLHGSSRPTAGSALIAENASGGLHAPRIRYGRNSRPSFSRRSGLQIDFRQDAETLLLERVSDHAYSVIDRQRELLDVDSETLRLNHQPSVVSEVQPQLQQP